jgi:SAM-dependent methyltransferase
MTGNATRPEQSGSGRRLLDIGCGNVKIPGAVGLDISPDTQADVVHDLNVFPWPFSAQEFDFINCQDVIEHLDDIARVMEELHRITKLGAEIRIRVPHFTSVHAFTDVTHKHFFSTQSFDYWSPTASLYPHYSRARFSIEACRLVLWKPYRVLGVDFLANRFKLRYEKMFAFIFPAEAIEFRLRTLPAASGSTPRR